MQQTTSVGMSEHSDEIRCLSSSLNRLQFPSPQRGRGVRGEGADASLEVPASVARSSSQSWVSDIDSAERYPPHPQPLSRVGVREAESSTVTRVRGFTLIELMMVLTVISILVSLAIPIANSAIIRSKEAVLRSNLYTLRTLIDQYTADKLKAPQSLDDIVAAGYLRSLPKDPITNRNDTWQIVMEDASLFPEQTETGIFDVHSGSTATSSEGTPYSEW
jgi:general secretion pathway protein G